MKTRFLAWVAVAAVLAACDSPLDTDPTASIDASTALSSRRGIELGLNGAYRALLSGSLWGRDEIAYTDLYADNLDFTGTFTTDREVSQRAVSTSNVDIRDMWSQAYIGINRANGILDAVEDVSDATDAQKTQYRGEALFLRGLLYSQLVRWFGGVPILLHHSEGVGEEALVARNTKAEVYAQIETDLEEAATLLPAARNNGRATKGAANALLARVYLDEGKNAQARDKATLVLSDATYRLNTNYADNFKNKNTVESIFEIQSTINSTNSLSFWFFPSVLGGRYGFAPSTSLNNAFEANDARKAASIALSGTSRYVAKYPRINTQDDNIIVLRLAEMYLIRAEANARLNASPATVLADLNALRTRAGLPVLDPAVVSTQQQLLAAVLQERRVETAFEDQRFFDLRRFGLAQTVLGISDDKLLFPIPQAEMDVNKNLVQNTGY